jgi:hypothetical protein
MESTTAITTRMISLSEDDLLGWAQFYAEQLGWPVLPLVEREKRPLTKHGLLDASTSSEQIQEWWTRWPKANIGLRTGVKFDVVDLDGTAGRTSLLNLAPGYKHEGPVALTGKGYHLLFGVTFGKNFANSEKLDTKVAHPGLDFRGQSGYIVAAPSVHPSGHRYDWIKAPNLDLPIPPEWLMELVRPKPSPPKVSQNPKLVLAAGQLDIFEEFAKLFVTFERKGDRYVGRCPFHKDDTPSLNIYDNNRFICYGCNAWGDALNVRKFLRDGQLR